MKKITLMIACTFFVHLVNGQTVPISFEAKIHTIDTKLSFLYESLKIEVDSSKSDNDSVSLVVLDGLSKFLVKRNRKDSYDDSYYLQWADKFREQANVESEKIKNEYIVKKDLVNQKMSETNNPNDFEILEEEYERLEIEESEKLDFIKYKIVKSKEYVFKARVKNKLTLFPVKNVVDAQLFYNLEAKDEKAMFLRNSLVNFSTKGGKASIFNEIYSDFFGPIRASFGALISNNDKVSEGGASKEDSTSLQQDATQRLLGGGGNGIVSLGLPFLNFQTNDAFFIKAYFLPKFSFDVPALGTISDKSAFNVDSGVEGSIFYTGALKNLTLFGNFRLGLIAGNSPFYENLLKEDKKAFFLNQFTVGFAINSTFRIGWSFYAGDSFVKDNFKSSISFSIIPKK